LLWLLEGKPFRIEKIGIVFVIVPRKVQPGEDTSDTRQETEKEQFVFKGTVVSQSTGEVLEYAVISLLDADGRLLINGITAGTGKFTIRTPLIPAKIKISYIGYENLLKDIPNLKEDLGLFHLTERVIQLDETVVTSDNINQAISHTTYTVTPQMQAGVDNTLELLNRETQIPFRNTSCNGQTYPTISTKSLRTQPSTG